MGRKAREEIARRQPPAQIFSYAQVEAALAKLYEAGDVQRDAFRGRLKHFRKLGLPTANPGKGRRIRYTKASDIFQLLIALELAEFGIDPHLIADIVRRDWARKGQIWQAINLTQKLPGNDFHLAIWTRFMSHAWTKRKVKYGPEEISISEESGPVSIHLFKISDAEVFFQELRESEERQTGRRFAVFNLSARVRDLERAITTQE